MRFLSIASGSSGNCSYVGAENTHILVDAGISGKRVEAGLNQYEITTKDVNGILITHEHSDHISGLGVLARKCHIPIYATKETLAEIREMSSLGKIEDELYQEIIPDQEFQIQDIRVRPFSISHDAANPVGYRFFHRNCSVAVATDMGKYDSYIVENLKGLDAILLEANHDIRMLETGDYPYSLKQRILGDYGHLSNESSGKLLHEVIHDGLKYVILGHLSKENDYEELAYETVKLEIAMGESAYTGNEFPIQIAKRDRALEMVVV